jgi:uncharacterized protein YndB with AHSA1/START domain
LCYLEVIENERLVWTNALLPGSRPANRPAARATDFAFTAVISLEPHAQGTRYTALVIHGDEVGRQTHVDMGFQQGWGTALDQIVAVVKRG